MSDPVAAGDFGRLMQVGAVGVVAAALLVLVVALVRRFVDHAIDSNKELQKQNHETAQQNLVAMHAMVLEVKELKNAFVNEIRELKREYMRSVADVVNDGPSGRHRISRTPSSRGGGSSSSSGGG